MTKRGETFPWMFGNLFDDFFKDDFMLRSYVGNSKPAVNVSEEKDYFKIEVAAPGMVKDDFKLDLNQNIMTISCEKKNVDEQKEKKYTRREFSFASFRRTFTLPESVNSDKIDASYKDGILIITLPKKRMPKRRSPNKLKFHNKVR